MFNQKHEKIFGYGSAGLYVGGKLLQRSAINVTGVPSVDNFLLHNLDSIFGAGLLSFGLSGAGRAIFKKDVSIATGILSAGIISGREMRDMMVYDGGFDFTDLIGGYLAIAAYTFIAKMSSNNSQNLRAAA